MSQKQSDNYSKFCRNCSYIYIRNLSYILIAIIFSSSVGVKFNNKCLQVISQFCQDLQTLCIGGTEIDINGLALIGRNINYYYTSLSFFLYKNMTVVLPLHPKINLMTIPPVVPVKQFRTIPPCGNFSNHISQTFLNHSSHWFQLNDVYNGMILSPSNRGQMSISIQR
jgi:hypothetical protein